jgi:hypothetical protein
MSCRWHMHVQDGTELIIMSIECASLSALISILWYTRIVMMVWIVVAVRDSLISVLMRMLLMVALLSLFEVVLWLLMLLTLDSLCVVIRRTSKIEEVKC